jgi:transcription elongation factor Elf1
VYRNKKLLELMRELDCQHCGASDGTVCACHSNQSKHGKGMGLKAPDSLVVALCHRCHYEMDNGKNLSKQERIDMWTEAYVKTMRTLIESERLIINDKN